MNNPITVAVTGSAGQVGYNLVFRIAAGELFGEDAPVRLRLHELEPAARSEKGYTEGKAWALEALAMEVDDCAFPLLQGMTLTSDFDEVFDGCSWAIILGAVPRRQGMERRDLVQANASTFAPLGKAISQRAAGLPTAPASLRGFASAMSHGASSAAPPARNMPKSTETAPTSRSRRCIE